MAIAARETGFLVSLMGAGLRTTGNVHAHQIKSLDWNARRAKLIERAPREIVALVLECLVSVLED
jgi:mRNA interferase ChpB